ncbi:MAG TPA: ribonuclease HII [Candidatus Bipolaricaulota bacterium]
MRILGLDEAGRGPVLGPLVVGATMLEFEQLPQLETIGPADSKLLTRPQRQALFDRITASFTTRTVAVEPQSLEENLTQVELNCLAALINELAPDHVFLDAPVPPAAIPAFVLQLRSRLVKACSIVAENKAESRYPAVAAASIVAKVTRDRAMSTLHEQYGDIGWGYPAEPKTLAFLHRCLSQGAFPPCVRTRWATVQRLKQRSLFGQ